MLQLSLGYVVQADREREVADDLRNRQALMPLRDLPAAARPSPSQPRTSRRASVRIRETGA